jgi:hypothetical protein
LPYTRSQKCGFGQEFDLQGHEVAEDARERDDHIDPRTAQLGQRYQGRTGNAAVAVKARQRAHERQRLADGRTLVFEVVTAPQHHGDGLGQRVAIGHKAIQQHLGMAGTVAHRKSARDAKRIKAVHVAPRGQNAWRT